jgi:enoyl-CoA hydratase/carnithine racemase
MTSSTRPTRRATGTGKLLAEVSGTIAVVTINNPDKRNALSREIREALPGVLAALDADPHVRVLVVTGAGDKAFASGADIAEFAELRTTPAARAEYDRGQAALAAAWASINKPVIAMIRGFCMGGGLLTALQADIRIAADDSQFGIPAARLGLGYGYSGVTTLLSLVTPAQAAEILFSARRFSAAEAVQMGLINRAVPPGDLREEVMNLAADIGANAPLTVAAAKATIRAAARPQQPQPQDLARIEAMIEACFRSEDYQEGQRAFAEKRPPTFRGR